jgi:predicted DNA-binding transcriptional regulator AlpA
MLDKNDQYMSAKSVMKFLDISKTKFYELRKNGSLPEPYYPISPHMPRYLRSEIIASLHRDNRSTTASV